MELTAGKYISESLNRDLEYEELLKLVYDDKIASSIIPLMIFMENETTVTLQGSTYKKNDLSIKYLKEVFVPMAKKLGINCTISNIEHSFMTRRTSGFERGKMTIKAFPLPDKLIRSVIIEERGKFQGMDIFITVSKIFLYDTKVIDTIKDHLKGKVNAAKINFFKEEVETGEPMAHVLLKSNYENSIAGFSETATTPEELTAIILKLINEFVSFHSSKAAVDEHIADMLFPVMAFAEGNSSFTVTNISPHLEGGIYIHF